MSIRTGRFLAPALPLALASLLATSCAPLTYDEAVDGDLSSDATAPTPLHFSLGKNTVTGSVTSTAPADTRDFLTFTIPHGLQLTALQLLRWRDLPGGGPANRGFHALNSGPTSFVPGAATAGNFLGGDHLDPANEGTDLLPGLADGVTAGTGFTVPLGPGTYSYVIQQTGPQLNGYTLQFVVGIAHHP
jgi:hypothetical protein